MIFLSISEDCFNKKVKDYTFWVGFYTFGKSGSKFYLPPSQINLSWASGLAIMSSPDH